MVGPVISAVAPMVTNAAMRALGGAVSGATGRAGANAALGAGTQGLEQHALELQKQFGVTPEQATAIASQIQEKERGKQAQQTQGSIYENAALNNAVANFDVRRGMALNAQEQQAQLANQLVNSVQQARDSATNAVLGGAQAAQGMFRGAIR